MPVASVDGRRGLARLVGTLIAVMEDSSPRKFKARTVFCCSVACAYWRIGQAGRVAGSLGRHKRGREINAKQSTSTALTLNLRMYK